jgi:hypothetical protein
MVTMGRRGVASGTLVSWTAAQAPQADSPEIEQRVTEAIRKMSIDLLGRADGFFLRAVPQAKAPKIHMSDGGSIRVCLR